MGRRLRCSSGTYRSRQGRIADVNKASRVIPSPTIRIRAPCVGSLEPRKNSGRSKQRAILSLFPGRLLRDQNGNQSIAQPFLVAVGTPLTFDSQHSVDIASSESPKNVPCFFFAEAGGKPSRLDEKGDGRALGIVPAAFLFLLDDRQFRHDNPGFTPSVDLRLSAS